ncbi:fimbrial protein [Salmonella enterica]|uniref:Fimbrial protein n=1 Tax=Salmonella enterica TaxID=28901 RepID=A0A701YVR3_SALER|nr:fimbrial protein [Salmonella enterica]HAC6565157.1 fimbrial protein [Salmonella enterica subsp. indica]HBC0159538.1 fimbrial protein [Salmonella enterica subsp. indica]HCM1935188.1 fimbrial protein [Salmonella enterica subsp. indica serovar 6,7:z41:1,7]
MFRIFMLFFIFCGGFFTLFPARADSCDFVGGEVTLSAPQMSIPADTPDGTVLYTSPKITKTITCSVDYSTTPSYAYFRTTADFNAFQAVRNGVKLTIYIDGKVYDHEDSNWTGSIVPAGRNQSFKRNVTIWFDIKVDSSRGKIPVSGTYLSGGFQSIFLMLGTRYDMHRGVLSVSMPNITYIPCTMALSVNPETIDFGTIKSSDLEKGIKFQRKFTTLIQKSKACTIAASTPFGINMFFEPTASTLNADGSLNLNNGLGLSISDTSGKYVPYNTEWKIDDVRVESILKHHFTANLQKISGQDLKTGPFSADVVVRINYY